MKTSLSECNHKNTPTFSINGTFEAKCSHVYDGDTAYFIFSPFGDKYYKYSCRMLGYNSAEIKGSTEEEKSKAIIARDILKSKILDKIVKLKVEGFDKYGRPLVIVYITEKEHNELEINLNEWMVDNGYGKKYNGKGEKMW